MPKLDDHNVFRCVFWSAMTQQKAIARAAYSGCTCGRGPKMIRNGPPWTRTRRHNPRSCYSPCVRHRYCGHNLFGDFPSNGPSEGHFYKKRHTPKFAITYTGDNFQGHVLNHGAFPTALYAYVLPRIHTKKHNFSFFPPTKKNTSFAA